MRTVSQVRRTFGMPAFMGNLSQRKLASFESLGFRQASTTTAKSTQASKSKPLYAAQATLPRLPVPVLESTLNKYLISIRPHVTDAEYQATAKYVEEFKEEGSVGHVLQQRLLDRAQAMKDSSWLIEWWNNIAYFGYRDSVVINVSYFYAFEDDPKRRTQTSRAASIIKGAMQFRKMIVDETLEPESTRAGPLCMHQYKFLFNTTRIPKKPVDTSVTSDLETNTHVVVLRKGKIYTFDLAPNGQDLSTSDIEAQLKKIIEAAGSEWAEPVGALTSDDRDRWTEYRELLANDPSNARNLEIIDKAVFAVCLDDTYTVTREETSRNMWHGDGRNRWFDKSFNLIFTANGKAGILNEHSKSDGTCSTRMCDWILSNLAANKIDHGSPSTQSLPDPQALSFNLNQPLLDGIHQAERQFDKLVAAHDLQVAAFPGYGKGFIKQCGLSPDAYVQMVIQLAYYRMFGTLRPTYESAQTRNFLHGRTETCRTVTAEVQRFVEGMADVEVPVAEKAERLKTAIKRHTQNMGDAVKGEGVDRHLFGLRLLLKSSEPKPAIFTDPVYARSSHWNLSTSQLSSEFFQGYGWGEVVPDGFGFAYMIKENSLQVNVACLRTTMTDQGAKRMKYYLEESMRDMGTVCQSTIFRPKAKL